LSICRLVWDAERSQTVAVNFGATADLHVGDAIPSHKTFNE
jgi:hypothetical protein